MKTESVKHAFQFLLERFTNEELVKTVLVRHTFLYI